MNLQNASRYLSVVARELGSEKQKEDYPKGCLYISKSWGRKRKGILALHAMV